jgi:hypothetical protein
MSGITGVERLYKMADKLPEVVDKALSEELEDAFTEPIAEFRSDVDDAIGTRFPTGYSGTFDASWNILAKVNAGGGSARSSKRSPRRSKRNSRNRPGVRCRDRRDSWTHLSRR